MTSTTRRPPLVSSRDAALWLWTAHGIRVHPDTIRQWAARHHIGSTGLGRARYDLFEVEEHARAKGLLGAG